MKGTILTILFVFIGVICVNAQVDEETKLKALVDEEKELVDTCAARMYDETLSEENRMIWRKQYYEYLRSYNKHYREYVKMKDPFLADEYTIPKAGFYLERSAKYQIAALCVGLGGGALMGILATSLSDENGTNEINVKKPLLIGTGLITGGVALGLYIASLIDKKKAGKILQNIQFTGNGLSYTF